VPGLRLAARGPADAPHRDHPVGLGLLRLWPDLHLALLRRAPVGGLCAVQLRTLVTGKLFEDIRDAVHEMADPARYDAIVVTNLCVPTASGVPLRLLPKEINGVRIIGIDVPGFGVPTHAEAKDVLAGAMLNYAREEVRQGRCRRPARAQGPADGDAAGRDVPGRSDDDRRDAGTDGPGRRTVVPCREWRELYAALDCAWWRRSIRSTPPRANSSGRPPDRRLGPVGVTARHAGWPRSATPSACRRKGRRGAERVCARDQGALAAKPIKGRITLSGYEGSELLVARLLIESGADVPYVGTACPRTRMVAQTANGWKRAAWW
jgi:3,8-divinyl chlorophyllide a/chlorophyllide a reductase subunit Y